MACSAHTDKSTPGLLTGALLMMCSWAVRVLARWACLGLNVLGKGVECRHHGHFLLLAGLHNLLLPVLLHTLLVRTPLTLHSSTLCCSVSSSSSTSSSSSSTGCDCSSLHDRCLSSSCYTSLLAFTCLLCRQHSWLASLCLAGLRLLLQVPRNGYSCDWQRQAGGGNACWLQPGCSITAARHDKVVVAVDDGSCGV